MGAGKSALHQKYKIKEVIGRGHFSIVKRCIDKKTGENLALKCINKNKLKEKDHRWLESEIEILTAVSHTNICRLVEVFQTHKMCYLVLELLQGGDLLERVADDHTFSDQDAADVIRSVAGVLDYLHGMGIIHRDLKPQNLVYRSDAKGAQLVVTDFGLSKFLKEGVTHTKTACGTPLYLAPEVIMGNGYGKECDLWSLGVMLYVLLTGYYPFYSSDRRRLYSKITRCSYKWPDNGVYIDERAKDLVAKLLVVDHKKRMSAAEVLKHPWITLPRNNPSENKARVNIRKIRAQDLLRKTVNYLIDIKRFISVFALLPAEVQKRCAGRTYKRKQDPGFTSRLGNALSLMATALVDRNFKQCFSLVYRMKKGGYWLVASDEKKDSLLRHAEKYFTKQDNFFIISGPSPTNQHRFLSEEEFSTLAVNASELQKTSPVRAPHKSYYNNNNKVGDGKVASGNDPAAVDSTNNKNNSASTSRRLSELEANTMVKMTAKLIASKLFSPPNRKVRFDFAQALDDDNNEEDKTNQATTGKERKKLIFEQVKHNGDDQVESVMTPRTLAALEKQVSTAKERLAKAKEMANKKLPKAAKKVNARELTIAKEALGIAKSLHEEAVKRLEDWERNRPAKSTKVPEDS